MFQRSTMLLAACVVALLVSVVRSAETTAPCAGAAPEKLVRDAAGRIAANYARIPVFRVTIATTRTTPGLKRAATGRSEAELVSQNGNQIRTVALGEVKRVATWSVDVIVRNADLRHEQVDGDGRCVLAFHRGICTEYMSRYRTAWRYTPEGKPGWGPRDPRALGLLSDRPLQDHLREDKVIETASVRGADGRERLSVLMEHRFPQAAACLRYRCELDPSRNHLPTRVVVLQPDGKIGNTTDLEYQEVDPGKVWFPEKAVQRFYMNGADSPDAEGWFQMVTHETVGKVVTDETFADSTFQIELPPGTEIRDSTGSADPQ